MKTVYNMLTSVVKLNNFMCSNERPAKTFNYVILLMYAACHGTFHQNMLRKNNSFILYKSAN